MLEITITLNIPGLMELAQAIAQKTAPVAPIAQIAQKVSEPAQKTASVTVPQQTSYGQVTQTQVSSVNPQTAFGNAPSMPASSTFPPMPPVQNNPAMNASTTVVNPPMPPQVATTHVAQSYTQEQIAVAMTELLDSGKMDVVQGILRQMGVPSLMQVPKDRYPELVRYLREAGGRI